MSLGFIPTFNPTVPSGQFDADGGALMQFAEALDTVASQHGLRPLTSFTDNRQVPDDFDGDPSDLDDALGPWEEWFSPADGLTTISALREHLERDPSAIESSEDAEWLLSELRALEVSLQAASSAGVRFRLEVVS